MVLNKIQRPWQTRISQPQFVVNAQSVQVFNGRAVAVDVFNDVLAAIDEVGGAVGAWRSV